MIELSYNGASEDNFEYKLASALGSKKEPYVNCNYEVWSITGDNKKSTQDIDAKEASESMTNGRIFSNNDVAFDNNYDQSSINNSSVNTIITENATDPVTPTPNTNDGSSNLYASNGIYNGIGPAVTGLNNNMAMPEQFGNSNSEVWGNNTENITFGGPGGPGSGGVGDPFGGGVPPDTPIDGGLSVLLAAAIGKGINSFKKKKIQAK